MKNVSRTVAATIIFEVKPQTIGRVLGTGLRVAGKIAGQRLAASPQPAEASPNSAAQSRAAGRSAGRASRGVARGVGGFLRPFGRIGGILWLEVTGVFFFLPVLVFAPTLWHTRASWWHGPDHKTFLVTAAVVLVFLYLGISSFWRAHRR